MEGRGGGSWSNLPPRRPSSYSGSLSGGGSLRCRGGPWPQYPNPTHGSRADLVLEEEDLKEYVTVATPKTVPLNMAKRRLLRRMMEGDAPEDGSWSRWALTRRKSVHQVRREIRNGLSYLEVWRQSLRQIEGQFGTGIRSYFSVVRFLVMLNLCSFLLLAGLVIVPSIVYNTHRRPDPDLPAGNCTQYDHTNHGLVSFYELILDLLSGTGYMEFSLLFYGYYPSQRLELWGVSFNLPLAYVLTITACTMLTFTWIVHRAVLGYKHSFLLSDGSLSNYSHKVFCGWDFCISQPGAVYLRHSNLRQGLKIDLEEDLSRRLIAERTRSQSLLLLARRSLVNLLTLLVIGASFYAIYRATEFSQSNTSGDGVKTLLIEYLPSMVITAANFVTPILFQYLIVFEQYSATTEIRLTLLRCVFLKLASLGVLLYSLWNQISCNGHFLSDPRCQPCGYNYQRYQCWETKIGQEMFKLMIFDFLIITAVTLFIDFPRKLLVDFSSWKLARLWGPQEFLVPQNVLELVYGQTICWTASIFSPLLPVIHTGKLVILFHLKKTTLFNNCRPGSRMFRSTRSTFFFLLVLTLGFLLSVVPFLYSLTSIPPSSACGPFRGQTSIWDVVPEEIGRLPDVPRDFLQFLGSLAFLIPLFALSSVLLLFLVIRASGYKHTIEQLRSQLKQEGRDKQFLLQKISALNIPRT